jgi:hypothetical protein
MQRTVDKLTEKDANFLRKFVRLNQFPSVF